MLSRVKLTNADIVRGRPTLKSNTECFRNELVHELKEKQRKLSRHSMTSKTHGPHRRNDKSEYQECTCKMDESLKRGMFNKFQSRKMVIQLFYQRMFYCSIVSCSTVPQWDVPLFHHDCSTVPLSDALLFPHQIFHYSTIKYSTLPPWDVLIF